MVSHAGTVWRAVFVRVTDNECAADDKGRLLPLLATKDTAVVFVEGRRCGCG